MSLYLSNNEPLYGSKPKPVTIKGAKFGRKVQEWVTLYFPDCKDKKEILNAVKNHIHDHFPSSGSSRQDGENKIAENAIGKILRIRGFSTFFRPVQVRNGYVRKNTHLTLSELNQLPELERIVSLLQDHESFNHLAISRILGIEVGQIEWLNYNTDCIIGERKYYQKGIQSFRKAGKTVFQAFLPIVSGWRFDWKTKINLSRLGIALKTQLISWSIASLVFLGLLFSTWVFIHKENKVPIASQKIAKIQKKGSIKTGTVNTARVQISQSPAQSHAHHAVAIQKYIHKKNEPQSVEITKEKAPELASTRILNAEFPRFPIRRHSDYPGIENIGNHEKIPIPLRQLQSKRQLKFRIGAHIQLTEQKAPIPRQISVELVAVKTIAFRKKLCFGIKYLPISYDRSTRVAKQFEQPNQNSKNVTDSVITSRSTFVTLPIAFEYELSPHFSVQAGLSAMKRIHDYGETHTILKGPTDGIALQTTGTINRSSDVDFAHFERESPFSNLGMGCHGAIQYKPSIQGNWLIRVEAMYGLRSKNKLYSISEKPPNLFWLGFGVSRIF